MVIKLKSRQLEEKAIEAFRQCMDAVPFARVVDVRRPDSGGADWIVTVDLGPQRQEILLEVNSSGQPRSIRTGILSLRQRLQEIPDSYGVYMAPYISEQGGRICEEAGIGYLDFAGNCLLSFRQVFIRRMGNKNPFSERRELRTLYSPKALRVLRVLLVNPRQCWKVQKLAQEADVSLGLVSNVKKLLEDREWLRSEADGFCLSNPEMVLSEWATNPQRERRDTISCYSLVVGMEFEQKLAATCKRLGIRYALTGFSAAARWAPMVRTQRIGVYVDGDVRELMQELQLKEVNSGATIQLIEPGDRGVFYDTRSVDGISLASPIQVYVDLKRSGTRGDEAAEALLNEVIRTQW